MTDDTALVRACAERVMQWEYLDPHEQGVLPVWLGSAPKGGGTLVKVKEWNPLTNETDSAQLLERMALAPEFYAGSVSWKMEGGLPMWYAYFDNGYSGYECSRDRKRAIAEAAVKCFEKGE